MTKNQKALAPIVWAILGIALLFIFFGGNLASIFGSSYQLSCSKSTTGWDCSGYGTSGGNLASNVIDDKTQLSISQPTKLYNQMVIETTEKFSGVRFFDYICDKNPDWCTPPHSRSSPPKRVQEEQQQIYVKELIGDQIMIIEGNVSEMQGDDTRNAKETGQTTKFYAFGNIDKRDGWRIVDPYPNDNTKLIQPTSFKIYVRKGGYTEADLCSEFQINCSGGINAGTTTGDVISGGNTDGEVLKSPTASTGIIGFFENLINKIVGWFKE
jgi:hypothetical protein